MKILLAEDEKALSDAEVAVLRHFGYEVDAAYDGLSAWQMAERGIPLDPERLTDCGASLYGPEQDAHAGGSGCGCIASVVSAHFLPMLSGPFRRIVALGSGAMLSPATTQQGESIPSISYAVSLEAL